MKEKCGHFIFPCNSTHTDSCKVTISFSLLNIISNLCSAKKKKNYLVLASYEKYEAKRTAKIKTNINNIKTGQWTNSHSLFLSLQTIYNLKKFLLSKHYTYNKTRSKCKSLNTFSSVAYALFIYKIQYLQSFGQYLSI